MGRKAKPFPRPYVHAATNRYTVKGEVRTSKAFIANIRTGVGENPLYLARCKTREEAQHVCDVYLRTGEKPGRKISIGATIWTRRGASGMRYYVHGRFNGKVVHVGTADTRQEAERISQRFKETGEIVADSYGPRGCQKKTRTARHPSTPRPPKSKRPKTARVRGPRVKLSDIKITPGRNLRDHEVAALERHKPHLVGAAPAKPVTERHRRPGESIQDWWRRLGEA